LKKDLVLKKYINTSWDDYYLNPYRFIKPEEESNIISSPDSLAHIINNLTNSAVNKFNKSNLELTSNNILINNIKNNDKLFNPLLFKLIANDNIIQLENILKNKLGSLNIDDQDKDGDTPLHISVFLANISAIKILINYGANIYLIDKWGQTSLHRICFSLGDSKSLEIIDIFIKTNKKNNKNIFNIQDNYGNTPCHLVLKHIIKNKTVLNKNHKLLIKKISSKTNKNLKNIDGFTIDDLVKHIKLIF
jgi:ankyrin repeat protein